MVFSTQRSPEEKLGRGQTTEGSDALNRCSHAPELSIQAPGLHLSSTQLKSQTSSKSAVASKQLWASQHVEKVFPALQNSHP